jgi:GABA permease
MHNPLRSETEVFRAVVIIGAGAALVVVLALAVSGTAGAIAFFTLVAVGLFVLWQRSQGTEPSPPQVANAPAEVHRVIVIANQTVGGKALLDEISRRCKGRRSEVLVITPALTNSQLQHWASDTDEATVAARARLETSVAAIRGIGLEARGEVGDQDPNVALADGLREFGADEVIISTHPPDRSRWLEHGVVTKARAEAPVPVTHVVVDLDAEAAPAR